MAFITIAGEQLIALKQGNGQVLNITHFVLANIPGLGAEPVSRIEALPIAGNIVDTQPVTYQGYVNSNQVVYSLALDSTIGDYDFNWIGLKAAGGELVACTYVPAQQKRKTVGSVPGNNLTRNFLVAFSGIAATTAITVPVSTWQIDFTTRLLQIDERERLSNFDIYGQSAFFGTGFKVSLQSGSTYAIAAGIGYVGGIRCEQAVLSTINITGLPKSIWIDASLQGDINGVSSVFSFTATAATLTNYTDANGFRHYVAKIADINSGSAVSELRPSGTIIPAGTRMPFYQLQPPVGWIAVSPQQDSMMRVVNSTSVGGLTVGLTGGSSNENGNDSPIINNTSVPAHTHTFTGTELAQHGHTVTDPGHSHNYTGLLGVAGNSMQNGTNWGVSNSNTGSKSTGITLASISAGIPSGTNTNNEAISWKPRYSDFCIGSKL